MTAQTPAAGEAANPRSSGPETVRAKRAWTRPAFAVASWALVIAVVVQVFLAGLGTFGAADFDLHRFFAFVLHAVTLALVALAALGRRGALVLAVTVALAALVFVQGLLVVASASTPVLGALHPVGALVLFAGALWLRRAPSPPRQRGSQAAEARLSHPGSDGDSVSWQRRS